MRLETSEDLENEDLVRQYLEKTSQKNLESKIILFTKNLKKQTILKN